MKDFKNLLLIAGGAVIVYLWMNRKNCKDDN